MDQPEARLKVQTSAKRVAIALGAGVLAFGMLAGAARAASTAETEPGMLMDKGFYAGAVPPIRVVDGRRVALMSAPEWEWIVKFGPYTNIADCASSVSSYSRGSVPESDYERLKLGSADAGRGSESARGRAGAECEVPNF